MNRDFEIIGKNLELSQKIDRPSMTYWQDAFRRLRKNKASMISIIVILVIVLLTLFAPLLNHFSFREMNTNIPDQWNLNVIKMGHYFGTDEFGRDFFTRLWSGGRISLLIAFVVIIIEGVVGTLYGCIAGFIGGKTDLIMMRIVEILLAVPTLIYIILLMVVLGPGIWTIIIAMGATQWLIMAMLVRTEVMKIKQNEFVLSSISMGATPFSIIRKHLIPNAMGLIIVRLTLDIPSAIFTEAFLSFIGIGVPAPHASWGSLANAGYLQLYAAPYLFFGPAILISVITLAFNILGDGLRDAMDPKLRK